MNLDKTKISLAGAGAGLAAAVVTCPLDLVKTRIQNQSKPIHGVPYYRGTFASLYNIFKEGGVRGLYRGLGPTILGYLPTWAIYFSVYDEAKDKIPYLIDKSPNNPICHMLSAMTAGCMGTIFTNPLWVIKTRIMTQSAHSPYQYKNTLHALQSVYYSEGIRGFYKGLLTSLFGVSHVIVQFPLYEYLKSNLHASEDGHVKIPNVLLASCISKMTASACTYPHEVIRTRLQNQIRKPYKYKGVFHAIKLISKEEGYSAFYSGFRTNLIRTVPASAITIMTYELIINELNYVIPTSAKLMT